MDAETAANWALVVSLVNTLLIACEWSYVILWTRRIGRTIVSGVLSRVSNLRTGRGKNRTAVEELAEEPPEEAPGAPPAASGELGGLLAGVDPRAIQEGLPLLKKFLDGGKMSPEETVKGLQLLQYAGKVAKSKGLLQGGGSGGGASDVGGGSGWS